MRRALDTARALVVSPEVAAALLPFAGYAYWPDLADVVAKPMREGLVFGFTAAALPLAMLAFNYRESHELLWPSESHKLLLEWPDYPMLRVRVLLAMTWCVMAIGAALAAVGMVAIDYHARLAVTILLAAILAAAAATASIGLARIRLREILGGR
jgi:hypothetical protein